jgi:hypothetical protein
LFAHLLHITPHAVDDLWVDDFESLVAWIDQQQAQQKGRGD